MGPNLFSRAGFLLVAAVTALVLPGSGRGPAGAEPATGNAAPLSEPAGRLTLTVAAERSRAYPGEAVPVTATLAYPAELTVRDIGYPQAPHPGLSLRESGAPAPGTEERDGSPRTTLVFSYLVSGRKSGDFILGPFTLDASLLLPTDPSGTRGFFGETVRQRQHLKSDRVMFTVVPFPAAGKPAEFRGAVGEFRLAVTATPRELPPGAPVTVTTRIEGDRGLDTVSCPTLREPGDFTPYPPQARQGAGAVVCEQVLIPKHAAVALLPPVRFSFFNPATGSYRTLTQGPLPIRIVPPAVREISSPSPSPPPAPLPGRGAAPAGADGPRRHGLRTGVTRPLPWLLGIAVAAVAGLILRRTLLPGAAPEESAPAGMAVEEDTGLAAVRNALAAGDSSRFYDAAFRVLQRRLGKALHCPHDAIAAGGVETALAVGGLDGEAVALIGDLLGDLDRVRYGGGGGDLDRKKVLRDLEEIVICLEKFQGLD